MAQQQLTLFQAKMRRYFANIGNAENPEEMYTIDDGGVADASYNCFAHAVGVTTVRINAAGWAQLNRACKLKQPKRKPLAIYQLPLARSFCV